MIYSLGDRSNIQDGCVLHGCTIGDNTSIGIGSTVLNGAKIGNNCVVGAHALVTENRTFPDGSLILGAPAKAVRELSEEEIAQVRWSADVYVKNAERFNSGLLARV